MFKIRALILTVIAVGSFCGCSIMGTDPATPQSDNQAKSPDSQSAHMLWGMWDFDVDYANLTVTPIPLRNMEKHFNITDMVLPPACNNCLAVVVNSYSPAIHVLNIDVSLYNAFGIAGYDVRGIVFTDASGHLLTNPDDWSPAYDVAGGMEINPFKAYAKEVANRKFNGLAELTENYIISMPAPPQFNLIKFAIDASWPTNSKEPYSVQDFVQLETIYPDPGSTGIVTVDVFDWQDDINSVMISAPDLADGWISMVNATGNTWQAQLVNTNGALAGEYRVEVKAESGATGITELYDFFIIAISPLTPPLGWARTWGGAGNDGGLAIAVDESGNTFTTGYFRGTVDFNPGLGVDEHITNGDQDAFLSKFDPNGIFQWARTWGGLITENGIGVSVDGYGNIYVTGRYDITVDFDPGPGVDEHTSNGGSDIFLSKFDTDGNFQWARTWGGIDYDNGLAIAADVSGNAYITGYFEGTVDFDPGAPSNEHSVSGSDDVYLSKFDLDGNFQWALTWGGPNSDRGQGVGFDGFDNVYITGFFTESLDFDPGPGSDAHSSNGGSDIFLSSFDTSGNFQWAQTWGGSEWDENYGVAVDGSGNTFITGDFLGTVDFDPGPGEDLQAANGAEDVFLSKFDPSGNFQWARTWGGVQTDKAYGVAIDGSSSVYTTGYFNDTVDFVPGPGVDEHSSIGYDDIFLSKFDTDGNFQWGRTWGGADNDRGFAVSVDGANNAYSTGFFVNSAEFDPGPGIDWHVSHGVSDAFLIKLSPDGDW